MRKIETIEELTSWLTKSSEGDRAEYYRGYLLNDRQVMGKDKEKLKIAEMAWRAYEQSRVTLVQKKNGDFDYSYIMESYGLGKRLVVLQ